MSLTLGMIVGKVTSIMFVEGVSGNEIEVHMEVRSDVRERIMSDSIPAVRTQGMLGDRYIDIPMGSHKADPLPEGKYLAGQAATDFDETLRHTTEVLNEAQKALSAINEKVGTMGRLFYDLKFYDNVTQLTNELNELIRDFKEHPKKYVNISIF